MCSARSYAEVMAEPSLAQTRVLAVTMPGHAGAPPPQDYSVESYARITAALAQDVGADLVVGFSMGATVAYEMVVSGAFTGPVVLLGVSLSAPDEPRAFRAIIRLGSILGTLPAAVLKKGRRVDREACARAARPSGAAAGRFRAEQHPRHAPRTAGVHALAEPR
jgi:pimeloyl-ACP methyl ester carboxylesterase